MVGAHLVGKQRMSIYIPLRKISGLEQKQWKFGEDEFPFLKAVDFQVPAVI